jgi:hypothetical protein
LMLKLILKNLKGINCQVLIKFWQNWFKFNVKHHVLRAINSIIIFRKRKNCLSSGGSLLLHQFTWRVIKLTVLIIKAHHCN